MVAAQMGTDRTSDLGVPNDVKLCRSTGMTDEAVRLLAQQGRLRQLIISDLAVLTDDAAQAIAAHLPSLETLHFSCRFDGFSTVSHVRSRHLPRPFLNGLSRQPGFC